MEKILLGLGSNASYNGLGPCEILIQAFRELRKFILDASFSSVYKTAAMYVTRQEDFYNMVVQGDFDGTPRELLNKIHEVENLYGRNRSKEIRFGPRSLDVDIELFGNLTVNEKDLIIPHERMTERAFVLVPYVEILNESADGKKSVVEFYQKKLDSLSNQRIEKFLDKKDFEKLVNETN